MNTIVVVGASVAGGHAVAALRHQGFDGRLVLVGAEPELPYERPPLSKDFLRGERLESELLLHVPGFYSEQRIELRLGRRARRLDARERLIDLDDGESLRYDRLLIATGAAPRRLTVPGAELPGVFYLRDLRDARALHTALRAARRVVVVGTGFIGMEVAATVRQLGLEVVALGTAAVPFERVLGPAVGRLLGDVHRARGVDLRGGETVAALRGQGRVEQVVTASGARFDTDAVVVGIGVVPETGWLAGAGVALGDGILVHELCRTRRPDVYAAGDVANWWHPLFSEWLRLEHIDNAQQQGISAARSMLGLGTPYAPLPYFWSDQYDLSLQYVGHANGDDRVVLRGSPDGGAWSAFYLRDGYLRAALTLNRHRDLAGARKLIAARVPVTAEVLADERCDLKELARRAVDLERAPISAG